MNQMHLEPEPMDRPLTGDGALASSAAEVRPAEAGNGTQALFRLDLLRSLQLHRGLALGIALACAVLAVAYWFRVGPVYQAESVVYIQPAPPRVMPQGPSTYESYIQQQIQNVTRAEVLTLAVHKLESGAWLQSGENERSAADRLRSSIKVTRQGTSNQFSIGAHASNAQAAADAANAVAASFIESTSHEQKAGDTQRLAVLGEERDRVQKALAADRAEQEALNKQLGVASIGNAAPDVYDEDIGRIHGELVKARTAHDEAAARLTSMDASHGSSYSALDAEADRIAATDPGLMSMKTSLNQRRAILISQMANLTPNHPQYKQNAAELAQINSTLEAMMTDLRAKAAERLQLRLRSDLERTAGVEAQLNGQLAQLTGTAGGVTSKMQRSNDLAIDINRLQNRFTTLDEEWRNLTLEESAPGSAFVSAAARPPAHAVLSGKLRNAALIVFAGLFFGMLAAVVAHKTDPRVYIAADVERVLGYTPMAQLPDFYEVPVGVAEEHLLRLAATIEYARKEGNLKSCIFTGTGPGTGVTTVATRVRALLESMGRATVLVDASGTQPIAARASTAGSVPPGVPASAAADSSEGWKPGTQALVAPQRGSRPTALLQQMADQTKTQGECLVLTDTAPLVVSAETEYLARFVDCAIVVAQSGVTTRAQLREAASTLQRLNVAAVGFVLNRVGLDRADPAFRHSVSTIEEHLDSQSSSMARRTIRSRPPAVESTPENGPHAKETAALVQYEPVVPQPAAVAAVLLSPPAVPKAAAPLPLPAVPDLSKLTARPAQLPLREPRRPYVKRKIQTMTNQDPNMPWWLADLVSQLDETNPSALPELATAPGPQSVAAELRPVAIAPKPHPEPQVLSWENLPRVSNPTADSSAIVEPKPVVPTNGFKLMEPMLVAPADNFAIIEPVPVVPAVISSFAEPMLGADLEVVRGPEQEEASTSLATRLSGLRSLLSELGVKNRQQANEPEVKDAEAARQSDPAIDSKTFVRTITLTPALVTPSRNGVAGASPRRVTAASEFLPPKPIAEEPEKSKPSRFKKRHDSEDDLDDVQVLPSRRGQYRK